MKECWEMKEDHEKACSHQVSCLTRVPLAWTMSYSQVVDWMYLLDVEDLSCCIERIPAIWILTVHLSRRLQATLIMSLASNHYLPI